MFTKFTTPILCTLAVGALLVACKKNEDKPSEPQILMFELSSSAETVGAEAGTKTFQVLADDAVNWSLTAQGSDATVTIEGVASGSLAASGTKTVSIAYPANRALDAKTYVFTVGTDDEKVATKSYTFTLTQSAFTGKYAFSLKDAQTVSAQTVSYEAGSCTWTVVADPEVEFTVVVNLDGTQITEGVSVNKTDTGADIVLEYPENTTAAEKVWTLNVTTDNSNVEAQTLTATLTQEAMAATDLSQVNADVIGGATSADIVLYEPAVVTLARGSYVYMQNSTGAILLYGSSFKNDFPLGTAVSGRFSLTFTLYNGVPEATAISDGSGMITATSDTIPCNVVTIAQLLENYDKYLGTKCEIKDIEVTKGFSGSARQGEIKDETGSIALYMQFKSGISAVETGTKASSIFVWPTYYKTNKQVGFFDDGDIVLPPHEEALVSETFKTTQGSFTINNIVMNDPVKAVWAWNSALEGCMRASAYVNRKNQDAQARLESPEFSLAAKKEYATLTFTHTAKFFKDAASELKVQYSIDGGENWIDATVDAYPAGKDWSTVDATVDLSAACGNAKVKFGFLYTSSSDASATWEIKNVELKAK